MRLLWIALAAATAITVAAVGGLVIGPRLLRHHHHANATAIAQRDIARIDLATYWRAHHHSHIRATRVLDPWGTPYRMTPSGQGFAISSAGPDRIFGTADDVR
ncbi:MAG TPA: hypothetical protein VH143_14955 [Kofleriaceae bacterium]|nr:hypothetical protein [Kofleriaceae bacterium]